MDANIFSTVQIYVPILVAEISLTFFVSYFLLLTVASLLADKKTILPEHPRTHFEVLIPAHNEEVLLPGLLLSIQAADYPSMLLDIHVVADNCSDRTAILAREAGVIVHERFNDQERGKGFALQWLIERITKPKDLEANYFVILDADSVVSENFFRALDAKAQAGEEVMQAYYAVREPERTWVIALRYVAMVLGNYLRPIGKNQLGCSAGLNGNGMAFSRTIVEEYPWSNSLTEDYEYHISLLLAGYSVKFVPDAVVWSEMPDTLRAAQSQNERWEAGRLEVAYRWVIPLLREAWAKRRISLFVVAIEHIIPPFSMFFSLTIAVFGLALISGDPITSWLGLALILGQVIYILCGLVMTNTPIAVYRMLLYAPVFIVWKFGLYIRVLIGKAPSTWVRTERNR